MKTRISLILLLSVLVSSADDWPTFRGNSQRTAISGESIEFPLHAAWVHTPASPPARAWTEPKTRNIAADANNLISTLDYDKAFHAIAAKRKVYYASSATDSVYCLNADGSLDWVFNTEGPVRLAPVYGDGRIFVGSDDGHVYCLDADVGDLKWACRVTPEDRRIPGNGRIISQSPVRGGLVVEDGLVYYAAGVFPSHGAYLGAIDASTGKRQWSTNIGVSPQGYLLTSEENLFVPTGRTPFQAYSRKDGQNSLKLGRSTSWGKRLHGGCFGTVVEGCLVSGPSEDGHVDLFKKDKSVMRMPALQLTVDGNTAYRLTKGELLARDWRKMTSCTNRLEEIKGFHWDQKMDRPRCLVKTKNHLVVGGPEWIGAFALETGKAAWKAELAGTVESMAVSDGRLYASADNGRIHCFAPGKGGSTKHVSLVSSPDATSEQLPPALGAAARTHMGYILVLGIESGQTLAALAMAGNCRVVGRDPDPTRVDAVRKYLMKQGLYGTRVAVHQGSIEQLPYTDYFANIVTSERDVIATPRDELLRVLRPHGGVLLLRSSDSEAIAELAASFPGACTSGEGKHAAILWRRPALDGEGEWTHFYADPANTACSKDKLISHPMKLQWFGRPGPDRMTDRHNKTSAPLYKNGRMIVPGLNYFAGVDAYNGTVLWEKEIPNSVRIGAMGNSGNLALDDDALYIATGGECLRIDPQSGEELGRLSAASLLGDEGSEWTYLAKVGALVYGSVSGEKSLLRREIRGRAAIWRGDAPMIVCSDKLFAADVASRKLRWQYAPEGGVILTPTVAIAHGRIYFVQSDNPASREVGNSQVALRPLLQAASIVALDATTGRLAWRQPVNLQTMTDVIYISVGEDALIVTGSHYRKVSAKELRGRAKPDQPFRTRYEVFAYNSEDGSKLWSRLFVPNRDHELGGAHGISIQHPSIVGDRAYGPGFTFDLRSGADVDGWKWQVGQKCGTVSTSAEYAFSRFSNAKLCYVFNLKTGKNGPLSKASRPGCWINIIPAGGLALVPEASAGCTCEYSVQASMAFLPDTGATHK